MVNDYENIVCLERQRESACIDIEEQFAKERIALETKRKQKLIVLLIVLVIVAICAGIAVGKSIFSHEVYGLHTVCFTTDHGDCYHTASCGYLWSSSHKTTVYRAKKHGLIACSKCSVGSLDLSKKDECAWGILACFIIFIPAPMILVNNKANHGVEQVAANAKKKKDLENIKYAKQIQEIVNRNGVLRIIGAPTEVMIQNDVLISKDETYYRYVTYSGNCYHSNPCCCGKYKKDYMRKVWAYDCDRLWPCSKCATVVHVPEWYKKYKRLSTIMENCKAIVQ